MSTPRLDTGLVRRRRAELGLSTRAVGAELGISATGYLAIESGHGNQNFDLGSLVRLSEVLGLSVGEMVGRSPARLDSKKVDGDSAESESARDVAALGALLCTLGELTPVGSLLEALGWTLERLHRTECLLTTRLAAVGMRIRRSSSCLAIMAGTSDVGDGARQQAVRQGMARNHVSLQEARMLRHVLDGDVPTQPSNPERVATGTLINAGLVAFGSPSRAQTEAPILLSDDVSFSLLLDEDPLSKTTAGRRRRSPVTRVR